MAKLKTSFAAVMLATSVAATNVSADNSIPDGTKYQSDDPRSTQIYDRVNNLPDDATHIYVPEKQYHDQLGERKWITENQFMRALSYLEYMGMYNGKMEYSHGAVTAFETLLDQFIDKFVVTDAPQDSYQNDIYAKYDMLRVHALENETFVENVLQQSEEYQRLEKKTDFHGDIKRLDGYLGLMGQDYNVGTKNDGQRIQAIQEFREGRTALDFLEQDGWNKQQDLTTGQRQLLDGGLALLGYDTNSPDALARFYKDNNLAIDPPKYNLQALAALHDTVVKDGKAFDRVEDVLYDFDTVEEKVGYAQAVLTLYGEHTEMDDRRWAHTMLNVAQLSRRMGDDLEVIKEDKPPRIFSSAGHVLWDSIRWDNYESGAKYTLPDVQDILNQTPVGKMRNQADQAEYLGGENMRWSELSDTQKEQFESRYVALPLSEFEKFLPENADELKKSSAGLQQIEQHLFKQDANGVSSFRDPALAQKYAEMQDFFKERIAMRPAGQAMTPQQLEQEAGYTAYLAMRQVLEFMYSPHRSEYSNDETSTLYLYLEDRPGGKNALKDSGNKYMASEHYVPVVHCINERNYLNYRADGGDPTAPVPFEEERQATKLSNLAAEAQQSADNKVGMNNERPALDGGVKANNLNI